ncbi:MAG: polysaccharide ABC transporter ATP-binding protein [Desulfomicrobium escambiense]|nr:polysaccharide ABC transporter ATP-binding protein [Desulfomicrobium escambiense]
MIATENLSKIFRLYPRPRDWLWEKLSGRPRHLISALTDVSSGSASGQCLGIIGANGAGKSTLLQALAGLSPPTTGRVVTEGRVAAILELDSGFHPEFTGRENIRIGAAIMGMDAAEAAEREREVIDFSGLGEFIDLPVRTYSSGMYLRLGFSLATAVAPDVLLVDEALAVGDEWFRGRCVDRISKIRERGAAVVIVSHDLTMVRALCDRALLLDRGRAVFEGETRAAINLYLDRIYEQAAAEAGRPGPGRRPAAGRARSRSARSGCWAPDGRPTTQLYTGQPFAVEFDYTVHADLDAPLFGLNLFRADGILAVCQNSESSHDFNLRYRAGPAARRPSRPSRRREPGRRRLPGGAQPAAGRRLRVVGQRLPREIRRARGVDEILGAVRFRVASPDHAERGMFICEGKWEIS